jgi:transcriptional regulator with XRE-family HTH domain
MDNTNINWASKSDTDIFAAVGNFIKHHRLTQNITQEQLAKAAGLNRYTINQIEKGQSVNLLSLIQLMRALDQLHVLACFEVKDEISPIEYVRLKKSSQLRERARNKNSNLQKEDLGW